MCENEGMKNSSKYILEYSSLPCGDHEFAFELDGELFREAESEDVKDACCQVRVVLHKAETQMTVDVLIEGYAVCECDRCLEDVKIPICFEDTLPVGFTEGETQYDGEKMLVAKGEPIDLSQFLYESVIIALPYQRVHEQGECNPEMLAHLVKMVNED